MYIGSGTPPGNYRECWSRSFQYFTCRYVRPLGVRVKRNNQTYEYIYSTTTGWRVIRFKRFDKNEQHAIFASRITTIHMYINTTLGATHVFLAGIQITFEIPHDTHTHHNRLIRCHKQMWQFKWVYVFMRVYMLVRCVSCVRDIAASQHSTCVN